MKELHSKLLEIAIDNNYTPEQVHNVTKKQVAGLLSESVAAAFWTGGNLGFFINLRENIAREIEYNIITPKISAIRTAIELVFPDAEYIVKKRQRKVIVYLDGMLEDTD